MKSISKAAIIAISYYLPLQEVTNHQLSSEFPDWSVEKIYAKTGIAKRYQSSREECASDLGVNAARKLFDTQVCKPSDIDFLLFCTQSPDYFLPTSACLMQDRLNIPTTAGALDYNLGCSGFIYGLSLAKGIIETGQARSVLLVMAETYSKFIDPKDRSVRTIFSDAGSATLIQAVDEHALLTNYYIGPFVFGTDGSGAKNLIVHTGGMRQPQKENSQLLASDNDNRRTSNCLYMNGSEIFAFTLRVVPLAVNRLLEMAQLTQKDIDIFIFHQANKYMLEHLQNKLSIPKEKFYICLENFGNTVSSTIPIALHEAQKEGAIAPGQCAMLVGFGVGYSWGATLVTLPVKR